jgi:PAS domain S-box-containing protein
MMLRCMELRRGQVGEVGRRASSDWLDLWRAVIEAFSDGVCITDPGGVHLEVNEALCRMTGFSRAELVGGMAPFPYWSPEGMDAIRAAFARTLRGDYEDFELLFRRKNGERFPALVHPSELTGLDGKALFYLATVKDISERKRAEENLRQSERRLQLALAGGDVGAFDVDLATGEIFLSSRLAALLGYAEVNPGLSPRATDHRERLHPDDAAATLEALERALATDGAFDAECRLRTASGEYRWFHGRGRLFRESGAPGGATTRFSGFVTDITLRKLEAEQRRRLEADLRQAQKLETLGTLAGGIAHDFNNLLVPILGNAQLALGIVDPAGEARANLEDIVQAAERARELVKRILVFGRRADERREAINVPALVREVLGLLEASVPAGVRLSAHVVGDPPAVIGDPNQLHQAITNLCLNACQALGARPGRIDVTVETVPFEPPASADKPAAGVERAVRLSIQDDGPGIPGDVLERIFDPFFTTKRIGEGSGLGLAIVHAVVTQHGGTVTAHSEPGKGALFRLCFPAAKRTVAAGLGGPATEPASPAAGRRILCVDDDPRVLKTLVDMLKTAQHHVTAFTSAREAELHVRAQPDAFDLLITDLTMPEMRGVDLAARVASLRPDLPVILLSGYGDAVLSQGTGPANIRLRLSKPVSLHDLLSSVDRVVAATVGTTVGGGPGDG